MVMTQHRTESYWISPVTYLSDFMWSWSSTEQCCTESVLLLICPISCGLGPAENSIVLNQSGYLFVRFHVVMVQQRTVLYWISPVTYLSDFMWSWSSREQYCTVSVWLLICPISCGHGPAENSVVLNQSGYLFARFHVVMVQRRTVLYWIIPFVSVVRLQSTEGRVT